MDLSAPACIIQVRDAIIVNSVTMTFYVSTPGLNQLVFIVILWLSVFLLGACGQTGDLYLPANEQQTQAQDAAEDKK